MVEAEDGSATEFTLRGATAVFTAEPGSAWPRLVFDRLAPLASSLGRAQRGGQRRADR